MKFTSPASTEIEPTQRISFAVDALKSKQDANLVASPSGHFRSRGCRGVTRSRNSKCPIVNNCERSHFYIETVAVADRPRLPNPRYRVQQRLQRGGSHQAHQAFLRVVIDDSLPSITSVQTRASTHTLLVSSDPEESLSFFSNMSKVPVRVRLFSSDAICMITKAFLIVGFTFVVPSSLPRHTAIRTRFEGQDALLIQWSVSYLACFLVSGSQRKLPNKQIEGFLGACT